MQKATFRKYGSKLDRAGQKTAQNSGILNLAQLTPSSLFAILKSFLEHRVTF